MERQHPRRAAGSPQRPGRLPRPRRRLRHRHAHRQRRAAHPPRRPLATAIQADPLGRQYYGRPPLREVILLPEGAQAPARKYLDWHREKVFIA